MNDHSHDSRSVILVVGKGSLDYLRGGVLLNEKSLEAMNKPV